MRMGGASTWSSSPHLWWANLSDSYVSPLDFLLRASAWPRRLLQSLSSVLREGEEALPM